ncbi:FecR family protein [Niabella insulamsoli]|uniref:FecR family protein n=1 Tax=Niabella insulamsoli TaxID=3144874 RepID=UPI0031FD8D3E
MSRDEFDFLLEKYLLGKCSPVEEQRVLRWYHQLIHESQINLSEKEKKDIEDRIWVSIASELGSPQCADTPQIKKQPLFHGWQRAAAAVFLLIVGGAIAYILTRNAPQIELQADGSDVPSTYLKIFNAGKNEKDFLLAEGSVVTLEPGSMLRYPATFTDSIREVYLQGDAFFNIHHDAAKPFFIHTADGLLTRVLGTSFYINQNESAHTTTVSVVTGRVGVYEEKKGLDRTQLPPNSIVITPNQKVAFNAKSKRFVTALVEDPKPLEDHKKQINNELNFTGDRPLGSVLQTLSRVYGVSITAESEAVAKCPFTGDIRNYDLYKQLSIICRALNNSYEINGTNIVIKGAGCK